MIQIIKITYHDDSNASKSIDIRVCTSVENAKEAILYRINKKFDGDWSTLKSAATELNDNLSDCSWDEDDKVFSWYDNGKGETYIIGEIERTSTLWQYFGEI